MIGVADVLLMSSLGIVLTSHRATAQTAHLQEQGVDPAPDGGYPNQITTEGANAVLDLDRRGESDLRSGLRLNQYSLWDRRRRLL